MTTRIADLINQYRQPSNTFIRREVRALEAQGWQVSRFTLRPFPAEQLADPTDLEEQEQTRPVLGAGPGALFWALATEAIKRPRTWAKALGLTIRLARRSERGLVAHLAYLAEACLLRRWLNQAGVAHVHAHFGTNSAAVVMLCQMLGGPPYSFTLHGPKEFDEPKALSLTEKIQHAAFVVAISSFGRSQLYRWSHVEDWPKIQVVHCGVDERFLTDQPPPLPTEPRLTCVGRLVEQKGPLILIEAASLLRHRGLRFVLTMVGDGPMRPVLEHRITEQGLEDCVRLLGTLDGPRVRHELTAARALVLPSFAEGLPVVLMEAMALGRPVISTFVAGIPELVRPGQEGWLVPAGSVEDLAEAMATVLTADSAELERMGRAGAHRVAERHNVHREASRLGQLLAEQPGVVPPAKMTESTGPQYAGTFSV